jgi:lipoate-protein ligase A
VVELSLDGHTNMARDCELLQLAEHGQAGFRVYTWDGVWVSLGRNQLPGDALRRPQRTRWVTRPTGGLAVLHGHDVTVGLALPFSDSSIKAYRFATAPLLEALRTLGFSVALAEDLSLEREDRTLPDCFASVGKNDVVHPGTRKKICGCALRRTRRAVLLQASIPAREPGADARALIREAVVTEVTPVEPHDLATALHQQVNRCILSVP